ncbi:Hypothetical_protein [Hexamita inflata]|uniref:Hypothetical_protein n=1 Tax=Hexamita inflata TaxID=28002 RepID=A0ABP1JE74_9EUKA
MLPSLPALKCVNSKSLNYLMTNSFSLNNSSFAEQILHNNTDDFMEIQNIREIKLIKMISSKTSELQFLYNKQEQIEDYYLVVNNNINVLRNNKRKLHLQMLK